jgi:hypothetical protein
MVSGPNKSLLVHILQLCFLIGFMFLFFVVLQRQHGESRTLWSQVHHTLGDLGKQHHWLSVRKVVC